jgi:hypothetical protein
MDFGKERRLLRLSANLSVASYKAAEFALHLDLISIVCSNEFTSKYKYLKMW